MSEDRKLKFFYGYVIVVAAFVIMVVAIGGIISFGVFFEPVMMEFGWTRAMTAGAFSLSVLLSGFLGMGAGRLNDRFGPRLVLTVSGLFSGLGYLLMSQISGIWQLYLFYGVIIGAGLSGYFVVLLSTVARWFVGRRGTMTGIVMAGIGTGAIIMPLLAGWLISSYGWRISYIVMGMISLVLIISATQFLRRDPQSRGQLPDGEIEIKQESSNLAARGFSFREAIHTRQLWILWATLLCLAFSTYAIPVHIVIHATGQGISTASAVNILAFIGGANIIGRLVMGNAGDRVGSRPVLIIGLSVMLAALVWLQFAKELWMLYLFGAIFGFAWGGSAVPVSPMIAELFGLRSHGVLYGLVNIGYTIGGTIGPVLAGYIFDKTGSYQLSFLILAVVGIIGLILALFIRPISSEEKSVGLS